MSGPTTTSGAPRPTGAPPATRDTTRVSQRIRPRIAEPFGWIKTIVGGHKPRYMGRDRNRNRAWFKMTAAIYNVLGFTSLDTATT
jgi:hypothetical protein